jgi:HTH-type transcriptional regulator / antitoxin MqsA
MAKNPRNYPDTMLSAESGRPMTRGEKLVSFKIGDRAFSYVQPGWWCSLTDPDDMEGQLVDDDNQIAEMARRTAKAIAKGEKVFVPVVIRAIRELCGLTQREAGMLFGTGEKSFEKYESGEILPSAPTKRLLKLAMERPELFRAAENRRLVEPSPDDERLARETLRAAHVDRLYECLFVSAEP